MILKITIRNTVADYLFGNEPLGIIMPHARKNKGFPDKRPIEFFSCYDMLIHFSNIAGLLQNTIVPPNHPSTSEEIKTNKRAIKPGCIIVFFYTNS